ncbi:hypothetical protein Ddye_001663 [Dipteronia dyeriana]|uniref:Reverse transcriptase zinc-binding domain-containing protein n=1 Tax=Dipteronia dyeriana TaxID=168575 RepID=A0AAD9XNZ1_9ROSI|nr:hypothetical protein Ddye_001663 [Dipteronia dyeriana]
MDNLARRKVHVSFCCNKCEDDNEAHVHVLFSCVYAEAVLIRCGWWHHIAFVLNNDSLSILERMKYFLSQQDFDLFCLVSWSIWAERNRFVLEGYFKDPSYVMDSAKTILRQIQHAMASLVVHVAANSLINVVGVGVVLHDHDGTVQACFALPRFGSFPTKVSELCDIRTDDKVWIDDSPYFIRNLVSADYFNQ